MVAEVQSPDELLVEGSDVDSKVTVCDEEVEESLEVSAGVALSGGPFGASWKGDFPGRDLSLQASSKRP